MPEANFICTEAAATAAKSLQSCPTLWDPIDGSPPRFSVHGIFQARVLEWGAIAFSGIEARLDEKRERVGDQGGSSSG